MMKLLALAALVAVALANRNNKSPYDFEWESRNLPERDILHKEFESNGQYEYVYNGQLMTGVPQSSQQHSGMRVQALVKLQFKTESEVYMQLKHIRFGYLNGRVSNPRRVLAFEEFEPTPVDEKLERTLRLPIKFTYKHGMIHDLHFAGAEQPWSANMKRSVINMLQVNLNKERLVNEDTRESRESRREGEGIRKSDFFSTMEKTIEGECETAYTAESLPQRLNGQDDEQNVLNVTKTINFEKCVRRPDIKYNMRVASICPTCENRYSAEERALRSSTIIKQSLSVSEDRRRYLIESAIVESQYTVVPFSEDASLIQTYANQTLVLRKTGEIDNLERIEGSVKSDSGLIYTPDWDIVKEEFFMNGEKKFVETTPYSPLENKIAFIKQILEKLSSYMRESVEEEAPRQFARLVKVMRMLKYDEIKTVHKQFFGHNSKMSVEHKDKVSDILIDAVAMCGTNDCVKHIVEVIEEGKLTNAKAAMSLRKLQGIRVVSPKMIERVFRLTEEDQCQKNIMVCQAAFLSTGSMLRAICSPSEDKLAIAFKRNNELPLCTPDKKNEWIENLWSRFESCQDELCRVTVLKAIGNAGIPESLRKLQNVIRNRENEYTQTVRVEAILATRLLTKIEPRKVERVLMPVYMNKMEKPFVRMAAVNKIIECQPEKHIVDQIARSLYNERSRQVASWTFTTLNTMANSTNPCEKRLAQDIKLSLRHARFTSSQKWMRQSRFLRMQWHSEKINRGFALDFNTILGNYSMVPKDIATSLHMQLGNFWTRYVATIGLSQNNMERYIRRAVRRVGHHLQTPLGDLLSGKGERINPKFNGRKELNGLYDSLDIMSMDQMTPEQEAFASIYLRFADQDYGFLPLTKQIIPESWMDFFKRDDLSADKIVKMLTKHIKDQALKFNLHTATFFTESSRKIPTTFGVPLQLSEKMPIVAQATGILKLNVHESNPLQNFVVSLHGLKPSFVANMVTKVEAWSPIVNTGLKVVASAKVFMPIEGKLSIDATREEPTIKLLYSPAKSIRSDIDIVRLTTRPVTTVLVWPRFLNEWQEPIERTIVGEQWTRQSSFDKTYGERTMGLGLNFRGHWHHTPANSVVGTPFCPLSGPNKIVISLNPTENTPKEIEAELTLNTFNKLNGKLSPQFDKFFSEEGDEFLTQSSSEGSNSRQSSEQIRQRVSEFEGENPISHKVKLDIRATGSPIKREILSELTYKCSKDQKTCKTDLVIRRTPASEQDDSEFWKLIATLETLYPKTPFTIRDLTSEKKFVGRLNAKWGKESDMKNFIDMKMVGEQTQEMLNKIRSSSYLRTFEKDALREQHKSLYSPVAQYEQTLKYGMLDQYKFDVDYQMSRTTKNITERVFRYLKNLYFSQTDIDSLLENEEGKQGKQSRNQVVGRVNIDPMNPRYMNVTLTTPTERVRMTDIPTPSTIVRPLNMRRVSESSTSFYGMLSKLVGSEGSQQLCAVRTDRISTFDEVEYRAPLTKCFSVIAKDCYNKESSGYAVLLKRDESEGEKKVLKIITGDVKLIARLSNNVLKCEINGEKKPCNEIGEQRVHMQHSLIRVTPYSREYIKIALPEAGIRVYFDGYAANVKLSPMHVGQVCGLCGHYDDEATCDLRTASNECVNKQNPQELKRLVRSFLVNDNNERDECGSDSEVIDNQSNYEDMPLSWDQQEYSHFEDNDEVVRRESRRFTVRPVKTHKVVEHSHEVCFSQLPIKRCPRNSYAVRREEEPVDVVYTCLDRHSRKAAHILRTVRNDRVVRELADMPTSFTKPTHLPVECRNTEM